MLFSFLWILLSAFYAPAPSSITIDLSTLEDPKIDLQGKRRVYLKGTYEGKKLLFQNGRQCEIRPVGTVHIYTEEMEAIILQECYGLLLDGLKDGRNHLRLIGGGIVTWGGNSDLTLRGIDILDAAGAGIKIKNDRFGRESPYYRNIRLENCRIAGAKHEGIYLGFYTYYYRPEYEERYAHSMRGLRVLNNEVIDCGWDGIQVSCADSATVIKGNILRNNGLEGVYGNNFGLSINSGFSGDITDNVIGGPVQMMPYSHTTFRRNIVQTDGPYAIFIRTEPNYGDYIHTNPDMVLRLEKNTIYNSGDAVYLLHTKENGDPVPIHRFIFKENQLYIGGLELRFQGDLRNYDIENEREEERPPPTNPKEAGGED